MALININNLSAFYENKEVFSSLSFNIEKEDYLCILGENGSGKTTLMHCILGFNVKHTGEIIFGDFSRNKIGWLPQRSELKKDFPASVEEVILSGFRGGRSSLFISSEKRQRALKNMQMLEIEALKNEAFEELSGGQQQKVLLARAMCSAGDILLLDEPVTGLDSASQNELYAIIKRLNMGGMTIIMISHDVNRSIKSANKILHLSHGKYFFGSTPDYLQSDLYINLGGDSL